LRERRIETIRKGIEKGPVKGMAHSFALVHDNLNDRLALGGIIMTMFDPRTALSREVVQEVRRHFPETLETVIPRNVRLAEAPSHGATIMEYAPASSAARAYAQVAAEVLWRLAK